MNKIKQDLVLASSSKVRRQILTSAGIKFSVYPANIDEAKVKKIAGAQPIYKLTKMLAETKALVVSRKITGSFVIGADQILECDGEVFDKPMEREAARRQLKKLRGKTHHLTSAVCVALNGEVVWQESDSAYLTMLNLSTGFIDSYLQRAGASVFTSVGAYRLEDRGIQLFKKIDGDYFTILGIPLLPLLDFLRTKKILGT